MELKEKFGKKIKLLRESLQLSQEEFAEKIDKHRTNVGKLENGKCFASDKTIQKIADVLCVQVKDLFDFDDIVAPVTNKNVKLQIIDYVERLDVNDAKYFLSSIKAYIKNKH